MSLEIDDMSTHTYVYTPHAVPAIGSHTHSYHCPINDSVNIVSLGLSGESVLSLCSVQAYGGDLGDMKLLRCFSH